MIPKKCLIACANERLLGSIVEDILHQNEQLVCSEVSSTSQEDVMAAIEGFKPDVLIICHQTHNTLPIQFTRLFMLYPSLLIITVSTDDNYMHIYGKQKVLISQSADLISAIQGE